MRKWRIQSTHFVLPKADQNLEDCEDAVGVNDESLSYAVADGATEAFDSRRWAMRLASEWVRAGAVPLEAATLREWLASQETWLTDLWAGHTLSWYSEEKRNAGSFAAFVGIKFDDVDGALRWRAVALGDSCLVHCREHSIVVAMPLASSSEFNSSPPLVPSAELLREAALAQAVYGSGDARAGDVFLLLSDAIAAWFLEAFERFGNRLEEFDSVTSASDNQAFAEFVRRERGEGTLKDDDVAVVRIAVH